MQRVNAHNVCAGPKVAESLVVLGYKDGDGGNQPPEWQMLHDKWEETYWKLFMLILLSNDEYEILAAYLREESLPYMEGRRLIFGF